MTTFCLPLTRKVKKCQEELNEEIGENKFKEKKHQANNIIANGSERSEFDLS